jgi:EAL domain-containing protein (putative c-di-GMP-specific phosphodiesterase class I)
MSFMSRSGRPRFDLDADVASPLAVATTSADRETLSMVRQALAQRRMRLAFQPAVYSADPSIIGFYEGYIRLLDPKDRVIPARDFMAVAETQELGREIDCAALQLGLLTLQKLPGIRVAVNMSARSIGYKPWNQLLRTALKTQAGIGRGLILEISEESAMQMPDVLRSFMTDLRDAGIAFTLDDFGAATTSLTLLRDFGFDIAKIDGKFIRGIDSSAENQPLVRAAIAMAREFGMFLVAESVETTAEASWLRNQGVGCLQGYLFGAPTVTPDFAAFRRGRTES